MGVVTNHEPNKSGDNQSEKVQNPIRDIKIDVKGQQSKLTEFQLKINKLAEKHHIRRTFEDESCQVNMKFEIPHKKFRHISLDDKLSLSEHSGSFNNESAKESPNKPGSNQVTSNIVSKEFLQTKIVVPHQDKLKEPIKSKIELDFNEYFNKNFKNSGISHLLY